MSTSAELLAGLLARGHNYADIGKAIGRNRSYVRQVAIGAKPGTGLRDSLAALTGGLEKGASLDQAAATAPAPARRTTASGKAARVRRPTTVRGNGWQTSTVKKAAARSGAHGMAHPLADAAKDGKTVAVTVSFGVSVYVTHDYGRRGVHGAGGTVEMELGPAAAVLDRLNDRYGGDFSSMVISEAARRGMLAGIDEAAADGLEVGSIDVQAIELRAY